MMESAHSSHWMPYSILMSVYQKDDPQELALSMQSMLDQTVPCDQFIIVEDGPIPDTLEQVITGFEKQRPSLFTILRLQCNQGLGNALNQGIRLSRNELICRMDADDISMPTRCEKQLQRFAEKPELTILGTQILEFVGTPDNIISMRKVPCAHDEIVKFARRRSPFNHPTVMYRKSVIESLGGYPTLRRKEDLGLFVSAILGGCYAENLSEPLLYYRTGENNLQRRTTWINCKEYIEVMYGFYKQKQIGISDLLYVCTGQLVMYAFPNKIVSHLSRKYLREQKK